MKKQNNIVSNTVNAGQVEAQLASEDFRIVPEPTKEVVINAIREERKALQELSKNLKSNNPDETVHVNVLLAVYYRQLYHLTALKTKEQWESEGFKVLADSKRYPAWGKPVSRTNKDGQSYTYYPMTYFYEQSGVVEAA